MGCCKSSVTSPGGRGRPLSRQSTIDALSDETNQLLQKASRQCPFPCKFVSQILIHNYLMSLRDRSIPDKSSVAIIDIRDKEDFDEIHLCKAARLELSKSDE